MKKIVQWSSPLYFGLRFFNYLTKIFIKNNVFYSTLALSESKASLLVLPSVASDERSSTLALSERRAKLACFAERSKRRTKFNAC
ncbi:MAG: hypothetical protein RRY15_03310, partial [Bacteroidales bacterium]